MQSARFFLSDVTENSRNREISNFMKIRPVGAHLFYSDGRTDRHDEANRRFSQFCQKRLKKAIRFFKQLGLWTLRGVKMKFLPNTFWAPDGVGRKIDGPFA